MKTFYILLAVLLSCIREIVSLAVPASQLTLYGSQQTRSPLVNWFLIEKNIPFTQKPPRPVSSCCIHKRLFDCRFYTLFLIYKEPSSIWSNTLPHWYWIRRRTSGNLWIGGHSPLPCWQTWWYSRKEFFEFCFRKGEIHEVGCLG